MSESLRPKAFALLGLELVDVGPLRGTTRLELTGPSGKPTNLYLLMGPNGSGKSTILEAIFCGMRLLGAGSQATYGLDGIDDGIGGLQLDARVELDDGERSRPYVLSIVAGEPGLLRTWSRAELAQIDAEDQITLIYERGAGGGEVQRSLKSHPTAVAFANAITRQQDDTPKDLFETIFAYPTVLYFTSERGIRRPPQGELSVIRPSELFYRPAHRFDADGASWADSLDNLFVWYAWLDDDRERRCRELVNDLVFRERKNLGAVDRQNLYVPVEVDGLTHRLHQLSSGERQLVQLVVRIASHMTGSTIVLIDETEQHLHQVLRRRLLTIIKDWLGKHPGLSFILTSHELETYRRIDPNRDEPGLVKSGSLVKPRFKPVA